ncbi:glycoside hydrolase family 28 protein [Sphingomonas mollis]|uniref:Glycoside hydrolase family 28 protein n=1 Tax=Sphingomonas mollis TaxID=2795726 RepID=A0ABS0XPK9_9SPHN|nr:glycoside hydrolase family 28 protein [Sphingomonas sp. BT553]MBJ6121976.1 glycoside hydrolase family 28 protein [Sphingomonas sp. BT553]
MTPTRRHLLAAGAALPLAAPISARAEPSAADRIARRIRMPRIPRHRESVAAHGGKGDGRTDCTAAIAAAIAACVAAGGGQVVLPPGTCMTGPIRLRSRVALHVPAGTVLRFIPESERYLPPVLTRWEGVELMGYHPLIYALDEEDVAVTGGGTIDGGADDRHWWPWKGPWNGRYDDTPERERQATDRTRLFAMAEAGVAVGERVFGRGSRLRPPLFQPYRCRRVAMEGVTVNGSPFWLLHPVACRDVTFRGVTCASHGPNNDGCDPESCTDVLIEDCIFDTGDDCIALKAGRNADGRRLAMPCENVVIRRCTMREGHAGVAIGSELTGGIRHVHVEDCMMNSPSLARMLIVKTNGYRGGIVEDIRLRRITVGHVETALIQLWMIYEEGDGGTHVPVIRDIGIADCTVGDVGRVLAIVGRPDSPVTNVRIDRLRLKKSARPSFADGIRNLSITDTSVDGRPFGISDVGSMRSIDVRCDKWAFCR